MKAVTRCIMQHGVSYNFKSPDSGKTTLCEALHGHNKDVIKYLLEAGADPNLNESVFIHII